MKEKIIEAIKKDIGKEFTIIYNVSDYEYNSEYKYTLGMLEVKRNYHKKTTKDSYNIDIRDIENYKYIISLHDVLSDIDVKDLFIYIDSLYRLQNEKELSYQREAEANLLNKYLGINN